MFGGTTIILEDFHAVPFSLPLLHRLYLKVPEYLPRPGLPLAGSATLLYNSEILVIGGVFEMKRMSSALLLDSQGRMLLNVGPLLFGPRYKHTATLLPNGNVLTIGGLTDGLNGRFHRRMELYLTTQKKFVDFGLLEADFAGHTATLLNNNSVLVAGGSILASSFLCDIVVRHCRETPLPSNRFGQTTTLLSNKSVFIAGGYARQLKQGPHLSLRTCEIFDPSTGIRTRTANLSEPRAYHNAILLRSGRILITGGLDEADNPLSSIEIYDPATGSFVYTNEA